jgi:DNA-binding MarR family transcriptional regulator
MDNPERLLKFVNRMETLGLQQAPIGKSDLTLPQIALLICVGRMPGSHANAIAETMNLTAPTVSVGLRKLEAEGWLRREADPNDKRASRLFLTAKATKILLKMKKHRDQRMGRFLGALSKEEQGLLIDLLEKASQHLD